MNKIIIYAIVFLFSINFAFAITNSCTNNPYVLTCPATVGYNVTNQYNVTIFNISGSSVNSTWNTNYTNLTSADCAAANYAYGIDTATGLFKCRAEGSGYATNANVNANTSYLLSLGFYNSATNLTALGFNQTSDLKLYFDTLYVGAAGYATVGSVNANYTNITSAYQLKNVGNCSSGDYLSGFNGTTLQCSTPATSSGSAGWEGNKSQFDIINSTVYENNLTLHNSTYATIAYLWSLGFYNSATNLTALGFNTTSELKLYFDTLYVGGANYYTKLEVDAKGFYNSQDNITENKLISWIANTTNLYCPVGNYSYGVMSNGTVLCRNDTSGSTDLSGYYTKLEVDAKGFYNSPNNETDPLAYSFINNLTQRTCPFGNVSVGYMSNGTIMCVNDSTSTTDLSAYATNANVNTNWTVQSANVNANTSYLLSLGFYNSDKNITTLHNNTYYLATNPSNFITASSLTPYALLSQGYFNSDNNISTFHNGTYYLSTNPSGYISSESIAISWIANTTNLYCPVGNYSYGVMANGTVLCRNDTSSTTDLSGYYTKLNIDAKGFYNSDNNITTFHNGTYYLTTNPDGYITATSLNGYATNANVNTNWTAQSANVNSNTTFLLGLGYFNSDKNITTFHNGTYYLTTNPDGYIGTAGLSDYYTKLNIDAKGFYNSDNNITTFHNNTYYLATNPSSYITSSSLTPYALLSQGYYNNDANITTLHNNTYYLATNPSNFISSYTETDPIYKTNYTAITGTDCPAGNVSYGIWTQNGTLKCRGDLAGSTDLTGYYNSDNNITTFHNNTYYLATNPSSYITSSSLTPYALLSQGYYNSDNNISTFHNGTYYLSTNPSSYITSSSLTPYALLSQGYYNSDKNISTFHNDTYALRIEMTDATNNYTRLNANIITNRTDVNYTIGKSVLMLNQTTPQSIRGQVNVTDYLYYNTTCHNGPCTMNTTQNSTNIIISNGISLNYFII